MLIDTTVGSKGDLWLNVRFAWLSPSSISDLCNEIFKYRNKKYSFLREMKLTLVLLWEVEQWVHNSKSYLYAHHRKRRHSRCDHFGINQ